MAVSYNKLWKLMIDKKINKSQLCKKIKISSSTMAKMTNEEMVAMTVLEKICAELECDIFFSGKSAEQSYDCSDGR